MVTFNYIFIFLFLSFGSIESKIEKSGIENLFRQPRGEVVFQKETAAGSHFSKRNGSLNRPLETAGQTKNGVVINEIMADPTPLVGLPDREYLELFNPGTDPVNLKNWILMLGSKQKIFPDVVIVPDGYLLVTGTGGSKDLLPYGKVVELSGFVLTNTGVLLSLYTPEKVLADQVSYVPSMHRKGFSDGGYSLERIDPERFCAQTGNWATTLSPVGGTPGAANSVRAINLDRTPPQVMSVIFKDHSRLEVNFSENALMPGTSADFLKTLPSGLVADSIQLDPMVFRLQIWFRPGSVINGSTYSFRLEGWADECGNLMPSYLLNFGYYLPVKSDLLINEVLFNPYPDGSDFVEIYNHSGHQIDLSELYLATRDENKVLKQISIVSETQQYLAPGAYLALTKSREGVLRFYLSKCDSCLLEMAKFPTLTDQSGDVAILDQNQNILDEMEYSDGMHDSWITGTEGISLERISFAVSSSQTSNWHSAARSSGFATPGYQNSAAKVEMPDSASRLVLVEPLIFSPNGDGINDELNIHLNTGGLGWILNITILNCNGRIVRYLANNLTLGQSDLVVWDGLDGDFQKVQPGIYILNISLFSRTGKTVNKRLACVVTDRL